MQCPLCDSDVPVTETVEVPLQGGGTIRMSKAMWERVKAGVQQEVEEQGRAGGRRSAQLRRHS